MSLRQAKTVDETVEWVKNAVFEVDDRRNSFEFEAEVQINETHRRGLDLAGEG